jgi:hypothetical protein
MMSLERTSTEACEYKGERIPQDCIRLSEDVDESNHGEETQPKRRLLVERIRQSIAAGTYLTPEKTDGTVERLYRELMRL